jgi:hypothetical protein
MEQLTETARVHRELEQAHSDLRQTLERVNYKVAEVEARLQPRAIVRRNPAALPLLAGLLGFLAGSDYQPRRLRCVAIGAVLGAVLAAAHRGSNNGGNGTAE